MVTWYVFFINENHAVKIVHLGSTPYQLVFPPFPTHLLSDLKAVDSRRLFTFSDTGVCQSKAKFGLRQ